jgi:hypothetical protein
MKNLLFIICFLLSIQNIFSQNEVIVAAIDKTVVYENFDESGITPFSSSKLKYPVDSLISLKILDEFEFENNLFGNILKVQILNGYFEGKIGFVTKISTRLTKTSIKKGVEIFITGNSLPENSKTPLEKETKCKIIDAEMDGNDEIFTIDLFPYNKNENIKFKNKNDFRFFINKITEINYKLRNGNNLIKVVDPETFFPIENIKFEKTETCQDGIIFSEKNNMILKKDGFSDGIIKKQNQNENIFLCFMSELEEINISKTENFGFKNEYFTFNFPESPEQKKILLKIFNIENFSIFSLPVFKVENLDIKSGFFIDDISADSKISVKINNFNETKKIFFFNETSFQWENINILNSQIEIKTRGFYILTDSPEPKDMEIKITSNTKTCSYFIKEKTGRYISVFDPEEKIILPKGEYELITFSSIRPAELIQNSFDSEKNILQINLEPDTEEQKTFNKYYLGKWKKTASKKDTKVLFDNKTLEFLGDLEIKQNNRIIFSNEYYKSYGTYKIADERKILITITKITAVIKNDYFKDQFYVSLSLFDSKLVIPAFYSFYGGTLQISFDSIFFERKKFNEKPDTSTFIKMETAPYGKPEFPVSEEKSKYKIYVNKMD